MKMTDFITYLLDNYNVDTELAFYGGDEEYHIDDICEDDFHYDEEDNILYL